MAEKRTLVKEAETSYKYFNTTDTHTNFENLWCKCTIYKNTNRLTCLYISHKLFKTETISIVK